MSEEDAGEVQETEPPTEETPAEDPRVKKANQEAANYRRELRQAQAELKKLRDATQTETEKALAEAEQRGASAALTKVGARLARAELKAAAAGRVPAEQLDGFLEFADLSRFIGEDGEPDSKAIEAAIKKLAPKAATSFDGGARQSAKPTDMNALIRRAAGVT